MKTRRAHFATIEIGADTQDALIDSLRRIITDIQCGSTNCTSGSPSAGYSLTYILDPEMTHERYFELIGAMLADGKL